MRLSIRHSTHYRFSQPAARGLQRLRLRPKSSHGQSVLDWTMTTTGVHAEVEYEDHHHNHTLLVSVEPGVEAIELTCTGAVETSDKIGLVGPHEGHMPLWAFLRPTPLSMPGPEIRALVGRLGDESDDQVALLHRLSAEVKAAMRYEIGQTTVTTSGEEALAAGHGVCQDHSHVFVASARLLGIPARYVSGYLLMDDRVDQEAGHAWAEAHVAGLGWVGFDVSNGISPDARYVRVASGCDYADAAPITGISFGARDVSLVVSLAVEQQQIEQ